MKGWLPPLLLAAVILLFVAGVAVVDRAVVQRGFLDKGPPDYSMYFAIRMALAVLFAAMMAMLAVLWNDGFLLRRLDTPSRRVSYACALFSLAGVIGFTALLLLRPQLFDWLAFEDSYVEWSSAAFLLGASALMGMTGFGSLRAGNRLVTAVALLGSAMLFVIAMEEISWMQRVIGFETPQYWRAVNGQSEFNVHNLATWLSENIYYGAGFVLLVLFPGMAFLFRPGGPLTQVSSFLPSRYAVMIGALSTTFSFAMWNVIWMQIAFFYGVLMLGLLAGEAVRLRAWRDAMLFGAGALLLPACHLVSLHMGDALPRYWSDTEYKELVVAAGLLLWALEAHLRLRAKSRHSEAAKDGQPLGGLSLANA